MSTDAAKSPVFQRLEAGDPPWFSQRTANNPRFVMDVVAGRYIVLGFHGTAGDAVGRAAIGYPGAPAPVRRRPCQFSCC